MRDAESDDRTNALVYMAALWRSRWLIAAFTAVTGAIAFVATSAMPDVYRAATRIVLEQPGVAFGDTNAEATRRRLATMRVLATAPEVLDQAASKVPGETRKSLEDAVEASVDDTTNIISVSAEAGDPERAAAMANAVAETFLAERAELDRERLRRAREGLERQLAVLVGSQSSRDTAALRERLSELAVQEGSVGSDLGIAEAAEPPEQPSAPRPLLTSLLALFAALFVAVLAALLRDRLVPRVSGAWELGQLLELPVLANVPRVGGRRRKLLSGVELESYLSLRARLTLLQDADAVRVILVTGAVHAEGKTTATARLGRALAAGGLPTLLVSCDLRVPRLHEMFALAPGFGLTDVLTQAEERDGRVDRAAVDEATHVVVAPDSRTLGTGRLDVITSGSHADDPSRLVSGPAMKAFLEEVRARDYAYVLLDGPPLLGLPDSQALARHVDDVLIVSRVDRITVDQVADLREALHDLARWPVGVVAIGASTEITPYYLGRTGVPGERAST